MKKYLIGVCTLAVVCSAHSAVFWTIKAEGVIATTNGRVALNIGKETPTGPNPADTEWEACVSNWIYFNTLADGSEIAESKINRMLGIALAAFKTNSRIRVGISRDSSGRCFTSQIYDMGP